MNNLDSLWCNPDRKTQLIKVDNSLCVQYDIPIGSALVCDECEFILSVYSHRPYKSKKALVHYADSKVITRLKVYINGKHIYGVRNADVSIIEYDMYNTIRSFGATLYRRLPPDDMIAANNTSIKYIAMYRTVVYNNSIRLTRPISDIPLFEHNRLIPGGNSVSFELSIIDDITDLFINNDKSPLYIDSIIFKATTKPANILPNPIGTYPLISIYNVSTNIYVSEDIPCITLGRITRIVLLIQNNDIKTFANVESITILLNKEPIFVFTANNVPGRLELYNNIPEPHRNNFTRSTFVKDKGTIGVYHELAGDIQNSIFKLHIVFKDSTIPNKITFIRYFIKDYSAWFNLVDRISHETFADPANSLVDPYATASFNDLPAITLPGQ